MVRTAASAAPAQASVEGAKAPVESELWRCDKCGTEYTADVGKCGQLQPPCDGTVRRVEPFSVEEYGDCSGWAYKIAAGGDVLHAEVTVDQGIAAVSIEVGHDPIHLPDAGVAVLIDALQNLRVRAGWASEPWPAGTERPEVAHKQVAVGQKEDVSGEGER